MTVPPQTERLVPALDVGLVLHAADTRLVYENPAVQRLLGLSVADLLTIDSLDEQWDVIHEDGTRFEMPQLPLFDVLRTGEPVRGTMLGVRLRSGTIRWLSVDAAPLRNEAGVLEYVLVTLIDVSHVMARRSLPATADSELASLPSDLLGGVLDAMAEGVAFHGPGGEIRFANTAAESILGLSLPQMQGRLPIEPWWGLTTATGVPLPGDAIPSEITRRTGVPQRSTRLGVHRPNGELRWLSVNTDPVGSPDADGHWSVVATFTDLSSEVKALAESEASRDRLRRLTEALPGAVLEVVVRPSGKAEIVFASKMLETIAEVPVFAVLTDGDALWRRFPAGDRDRLAGEWQAAATARQPLNVEATLTRPNGETRYVRVRSGAPDIGEQGTLFRAILTDITEQRQLEQSLRESQRRDAMGTLAAGIAHNFNNMLAAIVPNLETLRQQAPAELQHEIDDAWQAANAAAELVRQLMHLSRRESAAPPEPIDLAAMACETARLCRRTFDARVHVDCATHEHPVRVLGRRAELQQVILNLCLNARDALATTEAPRIVLRVTEGEDRITLEVADNGTGMSPEVRAHVGEPFFTTKPPGRGTGLGVASSLGILREIGASLRYDDNAGGGTVAVATFPRYRAPAVPTAPAREPAVAATGRGTVLLVDDEAMVRRALSRTFSRLGFTPVEAPGGAEALALLDHGTEVQLAVIDRSMPGMSGAELFQHLRRRLPNLPVVICSGYDAGTITLDAHARTLGKPYTQQEVAAVLAELLP